MFEPDAIAPAPNPEMKLAVSSASQFQLLAYISIPTERTIVLKNKIRPSPHLRIIQPLIKLLINNPVILVLMNIPKTSVGSWNCVRIDGQATPRRASVRPNIAKPQYVIQSGMFIENEFFGAFIQSSCFLLCFNKC